MITYIFFTEGVFKKQTFLIDFLRTLDNTTLNMLYTAPGCSKGLLTLNLC